MWRGKVVVTVVAAIITVIGIVLLNTHPRDERKTVAAAPVRPAGDAQDLERRELVIQALHGSPKAAGELIDVYDECSGHGHDGRRRAFCAGEVDRWLAIGLENGSLSAAQTKVMVLLQSSDCRDVHRAEYWYNRYRTGGFGDEIMWKSDATEIAAKKRTCSW